jgi:predicted ester cyclase
VGGQERIVTMNPVDIAKMQIDGFNDRSFRTNAQHYVSSNIVVVDLPSGQELHGVEGFKQHSEGFVAAMPDIRGTILDQKVNGNTVVTNVRGIGTFTGQLQTPQGRVPGNGSKLDIPYQLEIQVENDKIVRLTTAYDIQSFMSQLGLS